VAFNAAVALGSVLLFGGGPRMLRIGYYAVTFVIRSGEDEITT
jgi:hypothetical protein